jgi:hypothetical protein
MSLGIYDLRNYQEKLAGCFSKTHGVQQKNILGHFTEFTMENLGYHKLSLAVEFP